MNWRLLNQVRLRNERLPDQDADRQRRTAAEILRRFDRRPGIVLADEVGLGKTFVALAVAISVAADPRTEGPVVVMVPSSVGSKWPREWETFQEKCVRGNTEIRATEETVRHGSDFFKLLDDPVDRAHKIIFLTHRALGGSLTDPLVRLAIIRCALNRPSLRKQRDAFPRWARQVITNGHQLDQQVTTALMDKTPRHWRAELMLLTGKDPGDDPVPQAIVDALGKVDLSELIEACRLLPLRHGSYIDQRLRVVRKELQESVEDVWSQALRSANLHLPLLILDEAHHAKNADTHLAGLFASPEDRKEASLLSGPLARVFDRMLFLTATPLQLAHRELVEVLRRFEGIRWSGLDRDAYSSRITRLEAALDTAQAASLRLDRAWGSVQANELEKAPPRWWEVPDDSTLPLSLSNVARHVGEVRERTKAAERLLQPLVIRHSRSGREQRRRVLCGRAIRDQADQGRRGLEIDGPATLPFLLAARAQSLVLAEERRGGPRGRALFAEGIASSFEAYAHTRKSAGVEDGTVDDPALSAVSQSTRETDWYLSQISAALPEDEHEIWAGHPKIEATVGRAVKLWNSGEKVLIFCYFKATGHALREHISREVDRLIIDQARSQLRRKRLGEARVRRELELFGERFFDPDSPVTREAREALQEVLHDRVEEETVGVWVAVMLRFLRTPTFMVRHIGLDGKPADAFKRALKTKDGSGRTLRDRLILFADFVRDRTPGERAELLERLQQLDTGTRDREGELHIPNVRLANGDVDRQTRERLLRGFNSPFLPEILIASSVMAEGVDLHLNCHHVVHHDLDWNPSVIEQRTGRLDRLGSLAEQTGKPVVVFEPFLEGTQDEKMFRVMKDRERWFNVVMGERLELDEWSTERLSSRVALPEELANELALDLALR